MPDKTPHPTIRSLLKDAANNLQPRRITCEADRSIGRLEAEMLLAFVLKCDRVWLLAHSDASISPAKTRQFRALVTRRMTHEPVAHLTGEREFYRRSFVVNKHVLIPRPETELIIDQALDVSTRRTIIWDVGTGSGAIAVTLAAERPNARILATDVSSPALVTAKKNAKRHGVTKCITFLKSNLLQPAAYRWLERHARDTTSLVIVANLPYLPMSDKKVLTPDVVKYEPSLALFSGSDGLTLIKKFLGQLARHVSEWGYQDVTILLEFDPPQAQTLKKMAHAIFPTSDVTIYRDLAGRDRVMKILMRRTKINLPVLS